MHDHFLREMGDGIDKRETWRWLKTAHVKLETESLTCAP